MVPDTLNTGLIGLLVPDTLSNSSVLLLVPDTKTKNHQPHVKGKPGGYSVINLFPAAF